MANLFISYSRKDSKTAQKLIAALKDMGHHVWVDWESILPASDWLEQIYQGIEGADAFIFLVSPNSIKSEVCNVEVGHAGQNNKRIIPVVIKQVKPEDTNENVRKRNWVFLRRNDKYTDGLKNIQEAINVDFEWVEEHSRLQGRALEWDRQKDTSLLLRGRDLRRARRALTRAKDKEPLPTDLQNYYVTHSLQGERRRTLVWIASAITVVVLAGLSYYAFQQRDLAIVNENNAKNSAIEADKQRALAVENQKQAEENQKLAEENAKAALIAKQDAENQKLIAQAQRSAARAQIYQSQPSELYTSTLLAVASRKTYPTDEANEILRKNISLLPKPVNQMYHEGTINSLEFNTEGDLFVTGGVDGKACVWRAADGEMIKCFTSPKAVNDAAFSADGKYLVTGDSSGEVQIIRTIDWTVQNTYNAGVIVWDIDISEDGKDIAVTRNDGRIAIV
ncbi:MAG TPA: TIR domain-containing protein, partial [Anaerolineales bacterium]|nr:TIR domain-containing protein [Anaerolineales bacterium]